MSKLEEYNKLVYPELDGACAVCGIDPANIKQLFQELLDEVIGEYEMDVQELEDTPNGSFVPFMMKNDLRNEQRQRAKELLEEL
jgi:hypothetical protein